MILFEQALAMVLTAAKKLTSEEVPLDHALGRVLFTDISSDVTIPPADLSAMDGFACRAIDRDGLLRVIETIAAGQVPRQAVGPGACSRIMTGAIVPQGADCVVMFEHTEERDGTVKVTHKIDNPNIRRRAEDISAGDMVLSKGTVITPAVCAVLAIAGKTRVPVACRPRVAIVATGSELVEPGTTPGPAQIRNSNGTQLCAQTIAAGSLARYYGIAADTLHDTRVRLTQALDESDVLLVSGGVSAGDFDCVPDVIKEIGIDLLFESISIKPGKPTVFGVGKGNYVFGMPGNPVSTFVLFELLVRPFLLKLMGHDYKPRFIRARLSQPIMRRKSDRLEFVPVRLRSDGTVQRIEYHGSAHIHAYTAADGMVALAPDVKVMEAGVELEVRLIER
jgi:molybdopterin molybdotransferase